MNKGKNFSFDSLFTKSVPHILENIFLSLDYESFKACRKVNNIWKELFASESFKKKARGVFDKEIHDEIWLAVNKGNAKAVKRITSEGMVDINRLRRLKPKNKFHSTLLCVAATCGFNNIVQLLLNAGADPDLQDSKGYTPLMSAIAYSIIPSILGKILLESGADPNRTDAHGQSPLSLAVMRSNTKLVKLLLDGGAEPNVADNFGYTPLLWAGSDGRKELTNQLLQAGADPNITNNFGRTPLIFAAGEGKSAVVKVLLKAGADPNIADNHGRTPLSAATQFNYSDVVKILNSNLEMLYT